MQISKQKITSLISLPNFPSVSFTVGGTVVIKSNPYIIVKYNDGSWKQFGFYLVVENI